MIPGIDDSTTNMNTMSQLINKATEEGFTSNFKVCEAGLESAANNKVYKPEEVSIVDFYRFEGYSDPQDNAILYLVETSSGEKGTLTDAYGAYSDEYTSAFLNKVQEIQKKIKS